MCACTARLSEGWVCLGQSRGAGLVADISRALNKFIPQLQLINSISEDIKRKRGKGRGEKRGKEKHWTNTKGCGLFLRARLPSMLAGGVHGPRAGVSRLTCAWRESSLIRIFCEKQLQRFDATAKSYSPFQRGKPSTFSPFRHLYLTLVPARPLWTLHNTCDTSKNVGTAQCKALLARPAVARLRL